MTWKSEIPAQLRAVMYVVLATYGTDAVSVIDLYTQIKMLTDSAKVAADAIDAAGANGLVTVDVSQLCAQGRDPVVRITDFGRDMAKINMAILNLAGITIDDLLAPETEEPDVAHGTL